MRNIKLVIAYVGTAYRGFQKQPGGGTIQDELETFLGKVCGERVTVYGSGRTDAGVHALGQVVSFCTEGVIPCANIVRSAPGLLPKDIAVLSAEEMPIDFHARFSARWKEYCYRIVQDDKINPFLGDRAWQTGEKPDIDLMTQGAKLLLGRHNFGAFCSSGSDTTDYERQIFFAGVRQKGKNIFFDIVGNGFLYHMVRNIIYCLMQIGTGKLSVEKFNGIIRGDDKWEIRPAPAGGLYLMQVGYAEYGDEDGGKSRGVIDEVVL